MIKSFEQFSRIVAMVLLVTVSFLSCSLPSLPSLYEHSKLTPGKGTPCSFYLDSNGNYIETETGGSGRTGLIVENNKLAEGAMVYSDDTGRNEDRVAFVYEDSIVSMFFKKGSNFPWRMTINDGSDTYYAYLSKYNAVTHTYNITFIHDNIYEMMDHVVLNGNIFSLYQNDPELSNSQNLRMANMTIAMGVWGSLYATFMQNPVTSFSQRGIASFFKGVAKVFTYVAVAATVIATVVAPIIYFINPAAGLAVASVAMTVAVISEKIVSEIMLLFDNFAKEFAQIVGENILPVAYVSRVEPDGKEFKVKYNDNGVHEEFCLLPGKELVIKINVPFADFSKITKEHLEFGNGFMYVDEPQEGKGKRINFGLFEETDIGIASCDEELIVKIKRLPETGHYHDGIINFGFVIVGDEFFKIKVNDYDDGFDFRLPPDYELERYKNMVVIHIRMVEPS